jgi:hypothetical protein
MKIELFWNTINWLQNITNTKLKVIYYDKANKFVGLNCELVREVKKKGIEIISSIIKTLEQNHMAKQSHLVRHNAVLTIRLATRLLECF